MTLTVLSLKIETDVGINTTYYKIAKSVKSCGKGGFIQFNRVKPNTGRLHFILQPCAVKRQVNDLESRLCFLACRDAICQLVSV